VTDPVTARPSLPCPVSLEFVGEDGTAVGAATLRADLASDDTEVTVGPLLLLVHTAPSPVDGLITLTLTAPVADGHPAYGHLQVSVETAAVQPDWLIPGLFYGENRRPDCQRRYPRFEAGRHDPAGLVSAAWSFRSDRAATPAVFARGDHATSVLLVAEAAEAGPTGLGFAHTSGVAVSHVVVPYRESPVSYDGSQTARAPLRGRWDWARGGGLTVHVGVLPPDPHGYAAVLRSVHRAWAPPDPHRPAIGLAEAADIAAEGLTRWHYDPHPGVFLETVGFDRELTGQDGRRVERRDMHVAWISGLPWAYALLRHGTRVGSARDVAAARAVTDHVCSALSPSGTLWGRWSPDLGWTQSWTPVARGLHSRTLGEAATFLGRSLDLVDDAPQSWRDALDSTLAAVAARQRADGNVGSLHHADTGEVLSWEGAAGLMWVAAFAEEATRGAGHPGYLQVARRAGDYYARFVKQEFIYGAPEDVDLAPTSEDGYVAVMSYVALHRATGEARWLDLARRAAEWMLTFRYSYDVAFEPRTPLGLAGFRSRGADQASPCNQHLHAYGLICTAELLELSAALGDGHYRERAEETLACFRQLVPVWDGEYGAYRGMLTERYYQTNCFQAKGMVLTLSHAWSVGALLLGCEQWIAAAPGSAATSAS